MRYVLGLSNWVRKLRGAPGRRHPARNTHRCRLAPSAPPRGPPPSASMKSVVFHPRKHPLSPPRRKIPLTPAPHRARMC